MKTLKLMIALLLMLACCKTTIAQSSKSQRNAEKAASIKKMVDNAHYTFEANYVIPQRGGSHQLTSEYDLRVSKDSIIAFLPYFGEAHVAPTDPNEGGIKFTCTNFEYKATATKHGGWDIIIKPKDKNISDMRDVQSLRLNISSNGYASLQITSTNRDPISFDGELKL